MKNQDKVSMRRKDKEITDKTIIADILAESIAGHVAFSDGDLPYCIPVNFACHDNKIYLHSAMEGKKLDILSRNSNVSFQTEMFTTLGTGSNPCSYGMNYASVNCSGIARIAETFTEKEEVLVKISKKYIGDTDFTFSPKQVDSTVAIVVEIHSISGRLSGYTEEELKNKLKEILLQ